VNEEAAREARRREARSIRRSLASLSA